MWPIQPIQSLPLVQPIQPIAIRANVAKQEKKTANLVKTAQNRKIKPTYMILMDQMRWLYDSVV